MPFQSKTGVSPLSTTADVTTARKLLNLAGRGVDAAFRSLTLDTLMVRGKSALASLTLTTATITKATITTLTSTTATITNATITNLTGGARGLTNVNNYVQTNVNQGGITVQTDLTGLTVTITADGVRRVKITGYVPLFANNTAGSGAVLYLMEGATQIGESAGLSGTANTGFTLQAINYRTPILGSHTYKLQASNLVGGTVVTNANIQVAFIVVEDVGP